MLLSRTIKFIGVSAVLVLPLWAHGAELKFEEKTWTVTPQVSTAAGYAVRNDFDLATFAKQTYTNKPFEITAPKLDEASAKILDEASTALNQPTKAAKLVVEDGWAKEFEPGQNGQALDIYKTYKMLVENKSDSINLPVLVSKSLSSLEDTNDLGIRELVAVGESDFKGSPRNRRVNIRVGADKFQGLIIAPGEEFSFNKILGDVDAEHGFLPELVIKKTGTVPEFGGGLCQVSSTAFRAAMNAGLPITARRNHSYAVQYYAPQGTDATIYPGVQDFKFKNDLSSHLLIRTRIEGDKLYYDFYGTKDDRKVSFDGPYQFDKKASGAMKAVWTRWVEKDGAKTEQVFNSVYQSPALFHPTPQASTPNPDASGQNPNNTPPTGETVPAPTPTPEPTPTPTPTPTT
jgi:vancomycin resistance protein YoaR